MAQVDKSELQAEIKSSASSFYDIFRSQIHLLSNIIPEIVKEVKIVEGDGKTVGSIRQWSYVAGNTETTKETFEAIDEENKSLTFRVFDGDIEKQYKSLKSIMQVTPKAKGEGSIVKWTIEYEKQNESIPAPNKYMDVTVHVVKAVDAYLLMHHCGDPS